MATVNTIPLDPQFVKALKLLHSKNENAKDQLLQLYQEVVNNAKAMESQKDRKVTVAGSRYSEQMKNKPMIRPYGGANTTVAPIIGRKPTMQSISNNDSKSKDITIRTDDKSMKGKSTVHMDLTWGSSCSVCKKANSNPGNQLVECEELAPIIGRKPTMQSISNNDSKSKDITIRTDDKSMKGKSTVHMDLTWGSSCSVCKKANSNPGNQLVECEECHTRYHQIVSYHVTGTTKIEVDVELNNNVFRNFQSCHSPPVADKDVSDLRGVWYCVSCSERMKEMTTRQISTENKQVPNQGSRISIAVQRPSHKGTLSFEAKLVECEECHTRYHQSCHSPPVADKDVSDLRGVWYCVSCSERMKEMATRQISTENKQVPNQGSRISIAVQRPSHKGTLSFEAKISEFLSSQSSNSGANKGSTGSTLSQMRPTTTTSAIASRLNSALATQASIKPPKIQLLKKPNPSNNN
ncbi:Integrator complex subunit 12 [Trichoplax sp. H2]|nr:Integrator complex subunit 12 [Trichoplax sp. H2]|eukprot:RDD41827.1 Integrator complex subunit 12 [Trichoplax sp. H2]